jgi:hypothetical protein
MKNKQASLLLEVIFSIVILSIVTINSVVVPYGSFLALF